jgi:hypothetical protein
MRLWQWILLLANVLSVACSSPHVASSESQSLRASRAAAVDEGVRTFAKAVAHDITQEGPVAWNRYFIDGPAFFMASEGRLVFPNRASATAAIQDLTRTVKQIELQWGDDLRVDPLTAELAVVATSYHEVRVVTTGGRVDENGFFTGTAEYRDGRWQFRNAHWSVAGPPPAVR